MSEVQMEDLQNPNNFPNRRVVNLLSTFTFIGSILGFAFCLMSYIFWGGLENVLLSGSEEALELKKQVVRIVGDQRLSTYEFNGERAAFFQSMSWYYLAASFSNVLAAIGAFFMRAYKRKGFFIYLFSHILFFVAPFILVLRYEPRWGETAVLFVFAILFIALYARQLSHFK